MNNWRNGKRIRPKQSYCDNYCKHNPCNLTECDRRRLIDPDTNTIYMAPRSIWANADERMKKKLRDEVFIFTN